MTNKITKAELIDTLLKISDRMDRLTNDKWRTSDEYYQFIRRLAARDLATAIVQAMEQGNTTELERWANFY